ncbi:MAG: S9 family peptidase [Burkholderiaceae bacterium]|nr:S9 family peptidase [Burkholderiaceae bacterium]
MRIPVMATLLCALSFVGTATAAAPVAPQHPYEVPSPNGTRSDPYYWIRDDTRKNPEMLQYLDAENAYYKSETAGLDGLTEKIYGEIIGRIKQDDSTVPYKKGAWRYYTRFATGGEYPIFARKPLQGDKEEVLIDGNVESKGKAFFDIGRHEVSPNAKLMAYLTDTTGRRQYTLKIRDLATGRDMKEEIAGLAPVAAWAADNKTVFYIENDPTTLLTTRVKKHVIGTDPAHDKLVYEEPDHSYYLGLEKSGDDRYVIIVQHSTTTNGFLVVDAARPDSKPAWLTPRKEAMLYMADHVAGRWIINTDWNAPNYRIMTVADRDIGDRNKWQELIAHDKDVFIEGFVAFKDYLALNERAQGLRRLRVLPWKDLRGGRVIASDEAAYAETFEANTEQDSHELRYNYTSLTTPTRVMSVDMETGERKVLKEQPVPGYDAANYVTERIWATARDGVKVPVSLLYRKGFKHDGTAPLYQYAYGSYGMSTDPAFRSTFISLADRGFVVAIAHIRGGQEMGRAWYDDGKLMHKTNTFIDFLDVTDYLVAEHYAAKDKVFAMGGSAGGLLMGAVANLGGDKYRGIVAHVPFVDVVTTMLDESIPLTTNEFDEWGNPKQAGAYKYMLSYSPYDNVAAKAYPAMLVTTGLYDSQVQYYEPTKWVARLRSMKTDHNPLYLKINMEAGHGGKSGRFTRQHETAEEYAFILNQLGMSE